MHRSRPDPGPLAPVLDDDTKRYIARRVAEGKTEREAVRCLKRYLARSLFRELETMPQT